MVVRQGNPTPTLNITTATNPLVAPERDVFLQGFWTPGQANVISTKTRRVLQQALPTFRTSRKFPGVQSSSQHAYQENLRQETEGF